MVRHLGIKFSAFGDNYIEANMPVDERTIQPFGVLHGGASVVLAETLGSMGGYLCLEDLKQTTVGQEINANHLRSIRSGIVTGRAVPIHLGRKSQVWSIEIKDENDKLVAISRLTLAIISVK